MKKTTHYILYFILLTTSNLGHSKINPEYELNTKKPISSKIVIFITPTSEEIKKIKSETEDLDGFYAAADDYLYYRSKAMDFLDKHHFPYKLTEEKKIKFIVNNKIIEVDYSQSKQAWFVLIYNGKDKPTKTYSIDIDEHEALLKQLTESTSAPAPSPQ